MKFNFTSQISTTEEQSKRLLAFGLKAETADMRYQIHYLDLGGILKECTPTLDPYPPLNNDRFIPAWSLNRLIEMIPNRIKYKNDYYHFNIFSEITGYIVDYVDPYDNYYNISAHRHNNLFEGIISIIEWLIKEGYFNKKYLEE